jgi:hypothetical protein
MDDTAARADARLEAALADARVQDPRPLYRIVLRHLKTRDPDAFDGALRYFRETLVPAVAGDADPLTEWMAYGRHLADTLGAGRTVAVDARGRARPADDPDSADGLVLHVPDAPEAPVRVLRLPAEPAPAQRATVELLAQGRQTASAYE